MRHRRYVTLSTLGSQYIVSSAAREPAPQRLPHAEIAYKHELAGFAIAQRGRHQVGSGQPAQVNGVSVSLHSF